MTSFDALVALCYRFYPRGMSDDTPAYRESEQHRRLVQARVAAGACEDERWRPMLRRLEERFPENTVSNRSVHLPTGGYDACYFAVMTLPTAGSDYRARSLMFCVSFIAPLYVVLAQRWTGSDDWADDDEHDAANERCSDGGGDTFVMTEEMASTAYDDEVGYEQSFILSEAEEPYARIVAAEIERAFSGYAPLPPHLGELVVPEVAASNKGIGATKLHHCLFHDSL